MPHRLLIYFYCCMSLLCHPLTAIIGSDELIENLDHTDDSIIDKADLLPMAEERRLRSILDNLNAQTGAALVVVTLPSMEGGQIDDFTNRLFEKWGVGQKGKDNGVMLLVAVKERKMRIEVGYGLEGIIPDGKAGWVRDTYILPYFKKGQMAEGIEAGALALANLIAENYKLELSERPVAPPSGGQGDDWPTTLLVIIILVFIVIRILSTSHNGRFYGDRGWYIGSSGGGFSSRGSFSGGSSFGGFGGGMSGGGGASGSW